MVRKGKRSACVTLVGLCIVGYTGYAVAAPEGDGMAQVEADSMEYHEKESKVMATGNVQVNYDDRSLQADKVSYDQLSRIISADGDVNLSDKEGNVYLADHAQVKDDLTHGEATNVHGVLADSSIIAADKIIRETKDVTVLENAAYTPCSVCADKKVQKKPLWFIGADKVTIDNVEKKVTYKNATFNFFDTPVMYTPYLSHHMPGSGRKSGFLLPSYSQISTLGVTVKTPYYFNIAPEMDATVTPIFTSEEGIVMSGEFRHLTETGRYELGGSITNPKERDEFGERNGGQDIRGHIEGKGRFDFADTWAWGFDGKRATDDTYLTRYKFGYEDVLTSRAFVHDVTGRNFYGAETVTFQGLTPFDDPDNTPLILPLLNAHYEAPLNYNDSRFTLDSNAMVLTRNEGTESRRLSSTVGWELPHVTDSGHAFKLRTSLRGDAYSVEDVISGGGPKDGTIGRAIPEAQVGWSFPLAQSIDDTRVFIEPLADVIAAPNGGNPDKIPNEDSQQVELSDINLFTNNHFTGLDRVEGGLRTNYGFRGGVNNPIGEVNFLLGQVWRAKEDSNFTPETGMEDHFSDYTGRVSATDSKHTTVSYRFRTDKENFVMRHNEIDLNVDYDTIQFGTGYLSIDEDDNSFDREEILGNAVLKLTDNWSFVTQGRRNLKGIGEWIEAGTGLIYENECINISTGVSREFLRDRDIEPNTSYTLKLSLKNLGM